MLVGIRFKMWNDENTRCFVRLDLLIVGGDVAGMSDGQPSPTRFELMEFDYSCFMGVSVSSERNKKLKSL